MLSEQVYLTIYIFCQLDINGHSCFLWSCRVGKVTDSNHILVHLSRVIYISARDVSLFLLTTIVGLMSEGFV